FPGRRQRGSASCGQGHRSLRTQRAHTGPAPAAADDPADREAGCSYERAAGCVEQLPEASGAVDEMQPQRWALSRLEGLQVTKRLRQLQPAEAEGLAGYLEIGLVRSGHLKERTDLRATF